MEQHILKIDTPPEIATGPSDAPGFVILKTRFKNRYALAFNEVIRAANRVNEAIGKIQAGDNTFEAKALELAAEADQATEFVWETYAALVLDWNWIDDETGEPLPKPAGNVEVFKRQLYPEQTQWIRDRIQTLQKYRGTEGNAMSGNGSTPG